MATIRQQPDLLEAVGYPGSDFSLKFLKSGFPVGAVLSAKLYEGAGDKLSNPDADIVPVIVNAAGSLSEVKWTGVQTAKFNLDKYLLEIFIDGAVQTSGPIRFTRETAENASNTEPIVIDRGGDKILTLRPATASEARRIAVEMPTHNMKVQHDLNCDAIIGRCFGASGFEIEGPRLYPLNDEPGFNVRNWAYLDLAGIDPTLVKSFAIIPVYA